MPYVVILTKCDLVCDVKETNWTLCDSLRENERIRKHRDKLIDMFKFRDSKMFPVINYVHEHVVVPEIDALLLVVLKEILMLGKEYLEESDSDSSDGSES